MKGGRVGASDKRTTEGLSDSFSAEKAETCQTERQQQTGLDLWLSAAAVSPAPPPPDQSSAGERNWQNERPVCVCVVFGRLPAGQLAS